MNNEWTVKDSQGPWGSTDHYGHIISAPTGTDKISKAIRMHELHHAMDPEPNKPIGHEEAYEWLTEARIDFLISKMDKDLQVGIMLHRHIDVDKWVQWNDRDDERLAAKAAIIGRGYKLSDILKKPEDRIFVSRMLGQLSANPPKAEVIAMAVAFDNHFVRFRPKDKLPF